MNRFLLCVTCLLLCGNSVWADTVYKCKNAKGALEYKQSKCASAEQSLSSWETKPQQATDTTELTNTPYSLLLTPGLTGHYSLDAEVDSIPTRFLVDTGATRVTLTEAAARSSGLTCSGTRQLITASLVVMACETMIGKLTFGKFMLKNVHALILPNAQFNLLGMNVLSQLKIEQDKGKMILSMPN